MSDQSVGLVGRGPAIEAARAALADCRHGTTGIEPAGAGAADLVIVAGPVGDDRFERVNRVRDGPWLAVELGGMGGLSLDDVHASVAVLRGSGPCLTCLTARVHSAHRQSPDPAPSTSAPDARLAGAHAGRLALDILGGAGRTGTVLEIPYTERNLWPVPGCSCDEGRSRKLVRDHEPVPLDTAVTRAEHAVDPRLGPVVTVGEAESFPAPYYLAEVSDTSGFSDVRASRHAAGVAADWNAAFVKAVGEALERYAAGVYRTTAFEVASASGRDDAVPPAAFVRPDEADPEPDEPIPWVPGENLATAESVALPAERVVFPPPAERLGPAITTGLGLGTSGVGALVSGLTEVIERDATMLAWYSTYESLGLVIDDPDYDTLVRRARAEDLSVEALLVTQDIDVPVVTVAVHRDGVWPRFAVGSGAGLDPIAAARSGLEEALQNWMELRGMGPDEAAEEEPRIGRYAEFPPEVRSFVEVGDRIPAESVGSDGVPSGAQRLEALVERVTSVGLDAYAARLTPRDVETMGFEAVRVVVPAAQPLFTGERLFGERARTVPRSLGFRPRFDRPPHPYP